jgi:hypothetical protein
MDVEKVTKKLIQNLRPKSLHTVKKLKTPGFLDFLCVRFFVTFPAVYINNTAFF